MAAGGVLVGRGYVSIRPEFEGNWTRDASSRGGDAGKGASAAFGKAFSVGLKGIGQLAGVAIASNIATIAPAAAAIAPAMATAGAAVGALKIGLSGVGDAFKAAFADSSADAAKAAAATHAVESAQRSLANAQRGLADARRQAAQQVADAEDGVTSAERDLADAQKASLAAQRGLTSARQDAVRSLQDMNNQLADAQLSQRSAVLQLKDAQDALTKAQNNKSTTPEQLAQAQLAYDQAAQNLKEQRLDVQRLQHDTAAANKAGIEGSQQVADAKAKIASADQDVQDKEAALATAQAGVDKARADGQRQIQNAQRGVAEAASALAEAQAAAAAQTSALDQAMAKLAPNAQSFVRSIQGLAPAWDRMRLSVQNRLFAGLGTSVTSLANAALPVLQTRLTETAGIWNTIGQNAVTAAKRMATSGTLDTILKGANANLAIFEKVPGQVVTAFGQLAVAAQPGLNKLLAQAGGAINAFAGGLSKAFASGGLQDAIGAAFGLVSQLGTALGNVLGIVISVLKTAQASGGQILGIVGSVLGELNKIFASKSVQDALRSLFSSVSQIISGIVPAVGAVVQAVIPLVAALGPAIATVAKALGPVLSQLATALGAALLPIITALMPVVQQLGLAIVGIVRAVIPLLKPIGTLIASVVTALAPALTPIIGVITQLVTVLVGPLTTVVKALTPAFVLIGTVIAQAFTALAPILTPIVNLIGQAAKLIAGIFATALTALLTAIQPLIPVGIQLVKSVLGALAPILPVLGTALSTLAGALLTLLKPLTQVWISLYKQLAPVFGVLAPVIGQLAGLIATTLAEALPPLSKAFLILVRAVVPIVPLIGQVLGVVLNLGANLLKQLLPSLVQLISAALQLIVALTPILPPLAQVVGLVLKLAGGVLTALLPPLTTLATFLVGNFALGLSTIIGWLSSLVRWLAKITGPAVKQIADTISTQVGIVVTVFKGLFDFVVGKVLPAIVGFIRGPLASAFHWVADNIIKPIWGGISSTIGSVWKSGIKPTFEAVKDAVGKVGKAFGTARDAIGKSWSQIQDVTKKPVNFVISSVYTHGIKAVWDKVASFVHLPKLPNAPKLLAAGGTVGAGWRPATPGIYNRPTAIVGEGNSCIGRGSLIQTAAGLLPIEDVTAGQKVLTRHGFRLVKWSGLTRPDAEVLSVTTLAGNRVICTPDHQIWTARGKADGDRGGDCLGCGAVRGGGQLPADQDALRQPCSVDASGHDRQGHCRAVSTDRRLQQSLGPCAAWREQEADVRGGCLGTRQREEADPRVPSLVGRSQVGEGEGTARGDRGVGRSGEVSAALLQARASVDGGEHLRESARDPRMQGLQEGCGPRVDAAEACWREAQHLYVGDWVWVLGADGCLTADRVVGVEAAKRVDTFDLTVEGEHEFIAEGILVHNSHPEYVIPTDPRYRGRALALHQAAGARLMASGGVLGRLDDFLSGAAHGLSDATGKVWSGIKTAADITSHPEKAWGTVTAPVRKAILSLGTTPLARLVEAIPLKAMDGLKETLLTAVGLGGGGRSFSARIPTGQHRTVISQALAAAGVPPPGTMAQWLAGMNTLITRESGWNPNAINNWDSNAKAGHPSQGLTQTIPGTWAHYVPKALRSKGILDPVGNVAASIRYIVSRYGSITRVQQANASLPPKGYDSGGWLQPGYTMTYNGTGKPEAVFTNAQFTALMSGQAGGSRGDLIYNAAVREVASRQSVLDALATYDALHRPTVTGV